MIGRRSTLRLIAEVVPKGFHYVAEPDHPLLHRGPDALIAGLGSLVAVFVPHRRELVNRFYLHTRLIAARLALPETARCILVAHPGERISLEQSRQHFSKVIESNEVQGLRGFIVPPDEGEQSTPVPVEIRRQAAARFDRAFRASMLAERLTRMSRREAEPTSFSPVQEWGAVPAVPPKLNLWRVQPRGWGYYRGQSLSTVRIRPSSGALQSLNPFLDAQFDEDYALDNGMPYPRQDGSGILVVDRWPKAVRDPQKPIRAAAFAGLTLIPLVGTDLIDRIRDWLDRPRGK